MEKGKSYLPIVKAIENALTAAERKSQDVELYVSEGMEKRAREVIDLLGIKVNLKVEKNKIGRK